MTRKQSSEGRQNVQRDRAKRDIVTITVEMDIEKRKALKASLTTKGLTIKQFVHICADAYIAGKLDSIC